MESSVFPNPTEAVCHQYVWPLNLLECVCVCQPSAIFTVVLPWERTESIRDCPQEPKLCFYTGPGDQPTGIIRTKAMARKKSKQQGVGAKDLVSGQQQQSLSKKPGDAGAAAAAAAAAAGGGAGGGGDAGASRTNQVANANTSIQQYTSLSRFALLATWFLNYFNGRFI